MRAKFAKQSPTPSTTDTDAIRSQAQMSSMAKTVAHSPVMQLRSSAAKATIAERGAASDLLMYQGDILLASVHSLLADFASPLFRCYKE